MSGQPILFFDGDCGLCHRFVTFVLNHEQEARFQFAPLGGETFSEAFDEESSKEFPDSLILKTETGELLMFSDAAVYVLKTLSPGWRRVGIVIGVLPKPVRELLNFQQNPTWQVCEPHLKICAIVRAMMSPNTSRN